MVKIPELSINQAWFGSHCAMKVALKVATMMVKRTEKLHGKFFIRKLPQKWHP